MKKKVELHKDIKPQTCICLRQEADLELQRMELTKDEPTNDNRVATFTLESLQKLLLHVALLTSSLILFSFSLHPPQKKFIEYLLEGTVKVTPDFARDNKDVMTHIINCSTAILALSLKKCDIKTNPNPTVSSKASEHRTPCCCCRSHTLLYFLSPSPDFV